MCHIPAKVLTIILQSAGPATLSLQGPVDGREQVLSGDT